MKLGQKSISEEFVGGFKIITLDDLGEISIISYINKNNEYHREDGPAIEKIGVFKAWYFKGEQHREDGPAMEWFNGNVSYYLNGKILSEEDWKKELIKIKLKRIKNL